MASNASLWLLYTFSGIGVGANPFCASLCLKYFFPDSHTRTYIDNGLL